MSRASEAANSVLRAVEEVCVLYRVPCFRMQSRVFNVADQRKRSGVRPMMVGAWTDNLGYRHNSGMADLLAMPRFGLIRVAVPLWIECKSGAGAMTDEQLAFKQFVEQASAFHVLARDSADEVLRWFKERGVSR